MDSRGEIFACSLKEIRIGNIKDAAFDELWNGQVMLDVRKQVKSCKDECWMMCNVSADFKANFMKGILWVLRKKLA